MRPRSWKSSSPDLPSTGTFCQSRSVLRAEETPPPPERRRAGGQEKRSVVVVVPAVVTIIAVAAIPSVAAVPVGTAPVIAIVAPPAVVAGQLGQQIADLVHAAIQVRSGIDPVQDVPGLPEGPDQLLEVSIRAVGVVPAVVDPRMELIGLLVQLA